MLEQAPARENHVNAGVGTSKGESRECWSRHGSSYTSKGNHVNAGVGTSKGESRECWSRHQQRRNHMNAGVGTSKGESCECWSRHQQGRICKGLELCHGTEEEFKRILVESLLASQKYCYRQKEVITQNWWEHTLCLKCVVFGKVETQTKNHFATLCLECVMKLGTSGLTLLKISSSSLRMCGKHKSQTHTHTYRQLRQF